jgi:hypothetical protein
MGFLKHLTICLLAQASKQSSSSAGSSAASLLAFEHAVAYILLLIDGCEALVRGALRRTEEMARSGDVRFDEQDARENVARVFAEGGSMQLLLPLLSSMLSMRMNAPTSSRLLPRFLSLLQGLNELLVGLPSIVPHESDFWPVAVCRLRCVNRRRWNRRIPCRRRADWSRR